VSIPGSGTIHDPAAPRRPATPAASPKPKPPPWGGLEVIALTPTIFPALLFIPGVSAIRTPLRIADFTMVLLVWAAVLIFGGRVPRIRTYPPAMILGGCAVWLLMSIMHPTTNSLISGTAGAVLSISIMCPVFWVPLLKISPERLSRVLRLIFFANLLSALWGLGQVYQPDRFNPPDVHLFNRDANKREALSLTTSSGRTFYRPFGLTDTPGGAAGAAANVVIIRLILSLRPLPLWRRAILLGTGFLAMAIIYLSQVRVTLLTTVAGLIVTAAVFVLRRDFFKATFLSICLGSIVVGSLSWVAFVGGAEMIERFVDLLDEDMATNYQKNRGGFVQQTLELDIPRYPLGAGLGRWGQTYFYFGNKSFPFGVGRGELYSEVQVTSWVYDGGVPLLFGYYAALGVALWIVFRIALHANDPDVSFWACVIFTMGLVLLVSTVGWIPFIGPPGLQFWLLTTALYVANEQAGVAARKAKAAARRGAP